jgi:hypothetical protein
VRTRPRSVRRRRPSSPLARLAWNAAATLRRADSSLRRPRRSRVRHAAACPRRAGSSNSWRQQQRRAGGGGRDCGGASGILLGVAGHAGSVRAARRCAAPAGRRRSDPRVGSHRCWRGECPGRGAARHRVGRPPRRRRGFARHLGRPRCGPARHDCSPRVGAATGRRRGRGCNRGVRRSCDRRRPRARDAPSGGRGGRLGWVRRHASARSGRPRRDASRQLQRALALGAR